MAARVDPHGASMDGSSIISRGHSSLANLSSSLNRLRATAGKLPTAALPGRNPTSGTPLETSSTRVAEADAAKRRENVTAILQRIETFDLFEAAEKRRVMSAAANVPTPPTAPTPPRVGRPAALGRSPTSGEGRSSVDGKHITHGDTMPTVVSVPRNTGSSLASSGKVTSETTQTRIVTRGGHQSGGRSGITPLSSATLLSLRETVDLTRTVLYFECLSEAAAALPQEDGHHGS